MDCMIEEPKSSDCIAVATAKMNTVAFIMSNESFQKGFTWIYNDLYMFEFVILHSSCSTGTTDVGNLHLLPTAGPASHGTYQRLLGIGLLPHPDTCVEHQDHQYHQGFDIGRQAFLFLIAIEICQQKGHQG